MSHWHEVVIGAISLFALCLFSMAGGVTPTSPKMVQETQSSEEAGMESPSQAAVPQEAMSPWASWEAIGRAETLAERARLAEDFVQEYPESDLVADAHRIIAHQRSQIDDVDGFMEHALQALEGLPDALDLLTQLAFFEAEKGMADEAIGHASHALEVVDVVAKPASVPASQWVAQTFQARSEAHYALGRAYLGRALQGQEGAQGPQMLKAIENLRKALFFDPQHVYASFRLALASRNRGNVPLALLNYGRAAALGGVVGPVARRELEEVLGIVKEAIPDSSWAEKSVEEIIAEAGEQIEQEMASLAQRKQQTVSAMEPAPGPLPAQPPGSLRDGPPAEENSDPNRF